MIEGATCSSFVLVHSPRLWHDLNLWEP